MRNNSQAHTVSSAAFSAAELVFLLAIQLTHGTANRILCVLSILLAFAFSCIFGNRSRDGLLISFALAFTLVADAILQFTDPIRRLPAMLFFAVTQLLYAFYLFSKLTKRQRTRQLILYVTLVTAALILTAAVLKSNTDALSMISLFYYATLVANIFSAFTSRHSLIFACGLVFFILCDTLVGLDVMMQAYVPLPPDSLLYRLTHTYINLIWLFYVPAQTLIALSAAERRAPSREIAPKCKF